MKSFIKLYSTKNGEIKKFLKSFLVDNSKLSTEINEDTLEYEIDYLNPVVMSDIIGAFIDNKESYKINMWISFDPDVLINITPHNADEIIKYLYERFPY